MDIPPLSACSDFTSPLVICQKGLRASGLRSGRYSSINTHHTAPGDDAFMYECCKAFCILGKLYFYGGGGAPWQCLWGNQCWNVFTCRRKELILSKIFKKHRLLICEPGAGLRHLSEEVPCYNPQPLYKQHFVYSYIDREVEAAADHFCAWTELMSRESCCTRSYFKVICITLAALFCFYICTVYQV